MSKAMNGKVGVQMVSGRVMPEPTVVNPEL